MRRLLVMLGISSSIIAICFGLFFFLQGSGVFGGEQQPTAIAQPLQEAIELLPTDRQTAKKKLLNIAPPHLSPKDEARRLYILGVLEENHGDPDKALEYFELIKLKHMPALADRALMHIAHLQAIQGQEQATIKACQQIIKNYPQSISIEQAHYEISKSLLRQKQNEKAQKKFSQLKQQFPESQQAIGASYYLGLLSNDTTERDKLWQYYLLKSPKGTFAAEIARTWQDSTLSNVQKTALGLSQYHLGNKDKAASLLLGDGMEADESSWLITARLLLKKDRAAAKTLLSEALRSFPGSAYFEPGLNLFIHHSSRVERNALLDQLRELHPQRGAYLLWKKSRYNPTSTKIALYQELIKSYPNTKFAAYASGQLFSRELHAKNYLKAKLLAQEHLSQYSEHSSGAKVMFWLGKIYESENNFAQAKNSYAKIKTLHPSSYYAFRAYGRLKHLQGLQDPGWSLQKADFKALDKRGLDWQWPLPESEIERLNPTLQELFRLNLWQEAFSLLPKDYQRDYPGLAAWKTARIAEDPAGAIRQADSFIKENSLIPQQSSEYWLLSYPFLHWRAVKHYSEREGIDPLLLLSLIRQESRFQAKVVSHSNAIGLCQLLPSTAREVARKVGARQQINKQSLYQPSLNVRLGANYLAGLVRQFSGRPYLAVASYNAGPGAISRWIAKQGSTDGDLLIESLPYEETRNYVINVFENYWIYSILANDNTNHNAADDSQQQ